MYRMLRSLLFRLPPEVAHHWVLNALKYTPGFLFPKVADSPINVMGLQFVNRLGLAAGLDKNGDYIDALAKLGFGFIEVGSVTPKAQSGNPRPRLFRLKNKHAIINRMGFNNKGVDYLLAQLKTVKYRGILGINIGKNLSTPVERAIDDYLYCLRRVYVPASYITINISSPNTPNLRQLQQSDHLDGLLAAIKAEQNKLCQQHQKYTPLLVKISPDETAESIDAMASIILKHKIDGVIATNTTCQRDAVEGEPHADEAGGLSGAPLNELSTQAITQLRAALGDDVPIIGVGGIFSKQDAEEKIASGASLLQIYTGLIYKGPKLVAEMLKTLQAL